MIWPGVELVMAAYAVGTRTPGLIWGKSTMSTSGGTMLETLMRLTLPMPAARSALSNAFNGVPPSAVPAVIEALVTASRTSPPPSAFVPSANAVAERLCRLPADGHHHWRESKTQALFPCTASLVLYNSADFRPVSHRRRKIARRRMRRHRVGVPVRESTAVAGEEGGREWRVWGVTCCLSCTTAAPRSSTTLSQ